MPKCVQKTHKPSHQQLQRLNISVAFQKDITSKATSHCKPMPATTFQELSPELCWKWYTLPSKPTRLSFFYNIHPEKLCFTLHRNVFNLHQRVTLCVCVCTAAFVRLISPQQLYHVHPTPPTPTEAGVASVNSRNFWARTGRTSARARFVRGISLPFCQTASLSASARCPFMDNLFLRHTSNKYILLFFPCFPTKIGCPFRLLVFWLLSLDKVGRRKMHRFSRVGSAVLIFEKNKLFNQSEQWFIITSNSFEARFNL